MIKKIFSNYSLTRRFIEQQNASSYVLLACTLLSIWLSNLSFTSTVYTSLWKVNFPFLLRGHLPNSIASIIKDMLMPLFFFVIGAQIRRELLHGTLKKKANRISPLLCAMGGMVLPALIYILLNRGTPYVNGWGIAVATDIAFSLMVLNVLGNLISNSTKIFLMALAIFDDLGAIGIIAFFYGHEVQGVFLIASMAWMGLLFICARYFKKTPAWVYVLMSGALWYTLYLSHIHASITGIIVAMMMPYSMMQKAERALMEWVDFVILPLFVLANTAIVFKLNAMDGIPIRMMLGIFLGLVFGKPLGIGMVAWIGRGLGIVQLPQGANLTEILKIGTIAGIGFTMSIFVANLSISDTRVLEWAKLAILISSGIAASLGILVYRINAIRK